MSYKLVQKQQKSGSLTEHSKTFDCNIPQDNIFADNDLQQTQFFMKILGRLHHLVRHVIIVMLLKGFL